MLFFFQAEDGIRDYKVTGVQTCALPISATAPASAAAPSSSVRRTARQASHSASRSAVHHVAPRGTASSRSEERRVGRECSSRRGALRGNRKQRLASVVVAHDDLAVDSND